MWRYLSIDLRLRGTDADSVPERVLPYVCHDSTNPSNLPYGFKNRITGCPSIQVLARARLTAWMASLDT